jgi:hypothetical protein
VIAWYSLRRSVRLDLFNESSSYEGWSLSGLTGVRIIALGGGELAILRRDAV